MEKKVHYIPAIPRWVEKKKVGIYCRVSTNDMEQLNSLKSQISALTRKDAGVRVIFEQENLDTAETDSDLMISIVESFAQAENESRSDSIRWGIKQRAANGTSKLYDRKCYGYAHDKEGKLIINEEEAKVVRQIFGWYLSGKSILGILKELEGHKIKSPTGKDKWCKRTIDVMLSNEKYTGNVRLLDSVTGEVEYLVKENNPPIISDKDFNAVQDEKTRRSNVMEDEHGSRRKGKKYSSKGVERR